MTYTIKQLERVHAHVHAEAETSATGQAAAAIQQRVKVMDDVIAQMLVYGKRTMDRDELEPNVAIMIDHIWKLIV